MKMKTIVYRGGVLEFKIPASWKEEYSDVDGGMFYEDEPDSGTLRVKVITLEKPVESGEISLDGILESLFRHLGKSPIDIQHVGKNGLIRYDDLSVENGTKIRIYYWVFANPILPQNARVVTFSYTVLESMVGTASVVRELDMLNTEIASTEFSSEIGI
jgi:hypothetical protein